MIKKILIITLFVAALVLWGYAIVDYRTEYIKIERGLNGNNN